MIGHLVASESASENVQALGDILRQLEKYNHKREPGDVQLLLAVPHELHLCSRRREFFTYYATRYSSHIRVYDEGAAPNDISVEEGALSLYELMMLRRVLRESEHVGIIDCNSRKDAVVKSHSHRRIVVFIVDVSFDKEMLSGVQAIWRAYEHAANCTLYLVGKKTAELSSDLALDFGFCDAQDVDGKATAAYRTKIKKLLANSSNICVATKRVGHAHTMGLEIRCGGTKAELREIILEALKERSKPT